MGDFGDPVRPLLVGFCVWIGYTLDRLADSRQIDITRIHSTRHAFHHRHRRLITYLVVGVSFCVVVWTIRFAVWFEVLAGICFCVLAVTYLLYAQWFHSERNWIHKEMLASFLVSASVCLPVCLNAGVSGQLIFIFGMIWGLFGLNCYTIAQMERPLDLSQKFRSWVSSTTERKGFIQVLFSFNMAVLLLSLSLGIVPYGFAGVVWACHVLVIANWLYFKDHPVRTLNGRAAAETLGSQLADGLLILPAAIFILIMR